jgi:hypothetical protein
MLKEQLSDRLRKLRDRRTELVAQRANEIARIEEQITFCQGLLDNWDTFTIDEALAALVKTGVRIKLES